ncbi:hypothetical protein RB195_002100 [Necator americanus]|uniref:Endonuclease/exonuclease/phosphatase domain-containing protein n=1 Tax=Necator americanus TaxID=51031 RepID=A0ABR1DHD3_NECAM
MAICTYNARMLASDVAIKNLMMQARKLKYDVLGVNETKRRHPPNAVYETGEELFLGTCDSRGVGGVGILMNTSRLRSNIKQRRRRSRSFLYGPEELLPRRSCLLHGHNWRFQRQEWPKKNTGGTSHRDPRPTME